MSELNVLVEQLDELLAEGATDAHDALEIATVAGLAARLGGEKHAAVEEAVRWRDGAGADLLAEAWEDLDLEDVLADIDEVCSSEATEEDVEEAVYEFDDIVAAAVWCGQRKVVRQAAKRVADTIRQIPEPFAPLADFGIQMAKMPSVAMDLDVYDYWLAIADAGKYKDEGR